MSQTIHERQLDDRGRLQSETWRLNGRRHRTDGPALITYWPDGTVGYERWRQHGQLHRLDGPAITLYQPDGTVEFEQWWFQGRLLTKEQHTAQIKKDNQ